MSDPSGRLARFFAELRRRRVTRVAVAYAVVGWVMVEVAATTFPLLDLPDWAPRLVLVLVLLGLPLALVLAWTFDMTPGGVARTPAAPTGSPEPPAPARGLSAGRIAVVGAVAVLALAGAAFLASGGGGGEGLSADRVVVLPLENRTSDPALDPVGQLAADWVGQGVSREGLGELVPMTDLLATLSELDDGDGGAVTPENAARLTGAGVVVHGAFYRFGDELELQATVLDARRGRVHGSVDPVRAAAADPRDGVDVLRQRVTGLLAVIFDPRDALEGGTADVSLRPPTLEAYQYFADGMDRFVRLEYEEGMPLLLRAAAADSTFHHARLYAAIGAINSGLWRTADSLTAALLPKRHTLAPLDRATLDGLRGWIDRDSRAAMAALEKAARLAPNSGVHYQAGYDGVLYNRPDRTLRYLGSMDPSRGLMRHWAPYWGVYADGYHMRGEFEEELDLAHRAIREFAEPERVEHLPVRPLAALGRTAALRAAIERLDDGRDLGALLRNAALDLHAHGHAAAADSLLEEALAWYDRLPEVQRQRFAAGRAYTDYVAGRLPEAAAYYRAQLEQTPPPDDDPARTRRVSLRGRLGVIAARMGDRQDAEAADRWLRDLEWPYLGGLNTWWRAKIAANLGEPERAVRLLRRAYFEEGRWFGSSVHSDPELEPLWQEPEYLRLLEPWGE